MQTRDIQSVKSPVVTLDTSVRPIRMNRREIMLGLAAGSIVAFTGCAYNEQLGRNQLMLVSDGQMASLSARAWSDLKKKEKIARDPKYKNRLRGVGRKITTAANMNNMNWEYEAFESDDKNAFVLPGGKVGFYTGMMDFVDNDAQLAAIMGHEVGHVRARHGAERYSQGIASQVGMTAAQVAVAASDVSYGAPLISALGLGLQFGVLLPYSRSHELEADSIGLNYMTKAGYNPHQSVALWQKMANEGGGRRPPEFMSTHPDPTTRIAALRQQIAQMGY
ncbi:M48 family metallopeptidase [Pyruvatibacter sp.]|uniref:M48 family metallopeptidase n=1 Tax=Pyruvatibacter sp. TaxID=1981328 RepID=UPI0032EADD5B